MNELIGKLKIWLDGLNPRERRMVIGGAVFVFVFLLYQILWVPLAGRATRLEKELAEKQQQLIQMQQAAQEIRRLSGNGGAGRFRGSLLVLVESSLRKKLADSIRNVKQEGAKGVRVWLDKAPFDHVIEWLDELQSGHGVNISNFTVDSQPESGRVNVRILIEAE
ncbi:MAG: type II secretion system protein M [Gammaproteobacteria bacterium]|nr:type II secretion system protein M [Gammaproteobacteria bacterium]MDH5651486.1 type II secretion system protein M [Gammaproteobacteria bacterium]